MDQIHEEREILCTVSKKNKIKDLWFDAHICILHVDLNGLIYGYSWLQWHQGDAVSDQIFEEREKSTSDVILLCVFYMFPICSTEVDLMKKPLITLALGWSCFRSNTLNIREMVCTAS